jgi:transposase
MVLAEKEGLTMWTPENRDRYNRDHLRYPSDLTDAEWAFIEPHIPPAKRGGRKRSVNIREVTNGIMYVLSTGCQWRALPKDFPAMSTVFTYFKNWIEDRTIDRIHHVLYVLCRYQMEREASPTACIIDSQSVKGAEKGGRALIRMALMQGKRQKVKSDIYL